MPSEERLLGRAVWLSWEDHRRSRELAACLGIPLHVFSSRLPYFLRAVVLSTKTAWFLWTRRPPLVFVQSPSIVLNGVACLLRRPLGYVLIADRHSNFYETELDNLSPKWRLYHALSRYTVKASDVTIVTNQELKNLVEAWSGLGFVLPDKIPTLDLASGAAPSSNRSAAVISSHDPDEPLQEVLGAASLLPDVLFYVTGNSSRTRARYASLIPGNVTFTGYLSEPSYQSLLASCDVILALTSAPNTLLCGAYEAVALAKPLVISEQKVMTDYFYKGRIAARNTPSELAAAVETALANAPQLTRESRELAKELAESWQRRFNSLLEVIASLKAGGPKDAIPTKQAASGAK